MGESETVKLSVIVPSYNRAERLRICLEALARQSLPAADFEVIVVVDGSTDGTGEMLGALSVPYRLVVCWQPNSGNATARNRGLAAARAPYCLFLDDDIIAGPDLLAAHLRAQVERQGVIGVGQLTERLPADADGFARGFSQMWVNHYAPLNDGRRAPAWSDCHGANLSAPRESLLKVGGFATDLPGNSDVELGYRLQGLGLCVVYLPDALGEHDDCKDFHGLAAEADKSGRASVEIARRHPATLPGLLGRFHEPTPRAMLLRRLLLALPIPAGLLQRLSAVFDRRPSRDEWYRFLHSYFYWRGVRRAMPDHAAWRRLTSATPILMYHAFAEPGEPASRFIIPLRRFALQMAWLKWRRYQVLSLDEYMDYRRQHRLPPERSVVITIDDGYRDVLTRALPVLRRHAYPATAFLVTARVGASNDWDRDGRLAGRPLLSWSEARALLDGGLSLGAHTRTHPRLTAVSAEQARAEIAGSRADLEQALSIPVRVFSYPFGKRNAAAEAEVANAGYDAACAVDAGLNEAVTPLFALRRIEVFGTDSLLRFALALWVGDQLLPRRKQPC